MNTTTPLTIVASGHPDFTLQRHNKSGQWSKTILGHKRYFGSMKLDPTGEKAWKKYLAERDSWEHGINPREQQPRRSGPVELYEIVDRWLLSRKALLTTSDDSERIDQISYDGSRYAVEHLFTIVGKRVDPLTWPASQWSKIRSRLGELRPRPLSDQDRPGQTIKPASPATKYQRVMYVRALFEWAHKIEKCIHSMPDWGDQFGSVTQAEKDEFRYLFQKEHGQRRFTIEQARQLIEATESAVRSVDVQAAENAAAKMGERPHDSIPFVSRKIASRWLRAAVYLVANTGCNGADIADLGFDDLSLADAYIERLRKKTKVLWQATLWPETVEVIRDYLSYRPQPVMAEFSGYIFLTSDGYPLQHGRGSHKSDAIRMAFEKLLFGIGLKSAGDGINFGAWRHTFRSIVSDVLSLGGPDVAKKVDAINRLMAHTIQGQANKYVKLERHQLEPLTNSVRFAYWPDRRPAETDGKVRNGEMRIAG